MGHANGSSDDTTIVKIQNKKKRFRSIRTGAVFALIKAPPMQGNMHNDYLNPKGHKPQP